MPEGNCRFRRMKKMPLKIKRVRWWLLPLLITFILFTVSGKKRTDVARKIPAFQNDSSRKDMPGDEAMRVKTIICP